MIKCVKSFKNMAFNNRAIQDILNRLIGFRVGAIVLLMNMLCSRIKQLKSNLRRGTVEVNVYNWNLYYVVYGFMKKKYVLSSFQEICPLFLFWKYQNVCPLSNYICSKTLLILLITFWDQ